MRSPALRTISARCTTRSNQAGYAFASAQVERIPDNYIKLEGETDNKNMQKLLDMLEDNDDVQNVYHNWEETEQE